MNWRMLYKQKALPFPNLFLAPDFFKEEGPLYINKSLWELMKMDL